jgi:hypothetical protein
MRSVPGHEYGFVPVEHVPGMYEEILPENSQRRISKTLVRFQFVFAANNRKISMLNKNQDQAVFMYFLKLNKI